MANRYEIRHDDHVWDTQDECYVATADKNVIVYVVRLLNTGRLLIARGTDSSKHQRGLDLRTGVDANLRRRDGRGVLVPEFCPHCGIGEYDKNCGHPGDGCIENGTAR